MTTTYALQDDQGRTLSFHSDYAAALSAAEEFAGTDGIVGHDGDLSEPGGDRTLIWADEQSSLNDDGACAIGSIRARCDECDCWPCECDY